MNKEKYLPHPPAGAHPLPSLSISELAGVMFVVPVWKYVRSILYHSDHKFTGCYALPYELAQSVVHGPS
jgi:hypothetical protein